MKKTIFLLAALVVFISCKNTEKQETENEVENVSAEIKGDFIYFEDAAVLKGSNFIYGVEMNDKAKELAGQVEQYKTEEYDMISVIVKGQVNPKPEDKEGWEEVLTIEEIIFVDNKPAKEDVRIE